MSPGSAGIGDIAAGDRLRASIDCLHEGIQVIGYDWTYLYLNAMAISQNQRPADELLGRTMMASYPGIEDIALFADLRRVMTTRESARLRTPFVFPTGECRWFDLIVEPVPDGICIISLDVTDQHRLELALRDQQERTHQAHKMEAIGRLAAGIAHDFNNQLTIMMGFCDLALSAAEAGGQVAGDLLEVRNAGERATALTRQLLALSRRQVLTLEPVDLNELVFNSHRVLGHVLGDTITREVRVGTSPATILGDAAQIESALTQLAVNAADAMPSGGHLTISTSVMDVSADEAAHDPTVHAGRYAVITVSDTGQGMDETTKARMFEPFFTTKPRGKGKGLGLPGVYGAVQQMQGFIRVDTEVGRGTTFRLCFPTT